MPKYIVLDSLKHDGKDREIGSVVDMSEVVAAPLVQAGVLIGEAIAKAKAKADAEAKAIQEAADKAAEEARAKALAAAGQ